MCGGGWMRSAWGEKAVLRLGHPPGCVRSPGPSPSSALQVGMNYDIFRLSSLRLAPVQVVSYGHSSSTHGAEVDFFIGECGGGTLRYVHLQRHAV